MKVQTFKEQAILLVDDSIDQLSFVKTDFARVLNTTHPKLPRPRMPRRYITNDLLLGFYMRSALYNKPISSSMLVTPEFYVVEQKRQVVVTHDVWYNKLIEECDTPRKLCRALARLDAYKLWFARRAVGFARAEASIFESQEKYVDKLNARLGGLELANEVNDTAQLTANR